MSGVDYEAMGVKKLDREGEITKELSGLHNQLSELSSRVDVLLIQLKEVSRNEPPPSDIALAPEPPAFTSMGMEIRNATDKVRLLIAKVMDATIVLEL